MSGIQTNEPGAVTARLIPGPEAAAISGMSYSTWLRLVDAGRAPHGVRLGKLRRWDAVELNAWISSGCPNVRRPTAG